MRSVIQQAQRLSSVLERNGETLYAATHDWQSPLRSGGGPGCKNDHADPTLTSVIQPDVMALRHTEYKRLLRAKDVADSDLLAFHQANDPIDPNAVQRGRLTTDPGCLVCTGPAPAGHRRRGMCDSCRKRWERADRPSLEEFRRLWHREQEAATVRLHEHEEAS